MSIRSICCSRAEGAEVAGLQSPATLTTLTVLRRLGLLAQALLRVRAQGSSLLHRADTVQQCCYICRVQRRWCTQGVQECTGVYSREGVQGVLGREGSRAIYPPSSQAPWEPLCAETSSSLRLPGSLFAQSLFSSGRDRPRSSGTAALKDLAGH